MKKPSRPEGAGRHWQAARAACARVPSAVTASARPPISAGSTGSERQPAGGERRATWASPSSGSSEQVQKTSVPPGFSNAAARGDHARLKRGKRGDVLRPLQPWATSGWRRIVPVAVQGASSRIASNSARRTPGDGVRGDGLGGETEAREIRRQPRAGARRDVDGGDDRAGVGERRGLAARRGAEVGDALARDVAEKARRQAPRRHPAPTMRPRQSRAWPRPGPRESGGR